MNAETCTTCTRPVTTPYCVKNSNGTVVAGCVDACHANSLYISAYSTWYNRPEAKKIRTVTAKGRKGNGY